MHKTTDSLYIQSDHNRVMYDEIIPNSRGRAEFVRRTFHKVTLKIYYLYSFNTIYNLHRIYCI